MGRQMKRRKRRRRRRKRWRRRRKRRKRRRTIAEVVNFPSCCVARRYSLSIIIIFCVLFAKDLTLFSSSLAISWPTACEFKRDQIFVSKTFALQVSVSRCGHFMGGGAEGRPKGILKIPLLKGKLFNLNKISYPG